MTDSELVNADCGLRVAVLLDDGGGQVLKEIVLAPDGKVESLKGSFLVDAESGRLAQAALEERGTDIAVDYEHQSLGGEYSSPSGKAPAAGWIKRVWYETGKGLVAAVEWTEAAAKMIRGKEYKYLSPAAIIRKEDGKLVAIDSGALTNRPAIRGMAALAASDRFQETELLLMADNDGQQAAEVKALLGKLQALLGLEENTAALDVLKAVVAKLEALLSDDEGDEGTDKQVAESVRALLDLPAGAGKSAVVLALKTRDVSDAGTALVEMRQAEAGRIAAEHVDRYVKAMKLNANDFEGMSAALELARTNPDLLDQLMANAASVMPPQGRTTPPGQTDVSRTQAIVAASRDYRGDKGMQKTCSMQAAINLALREAGMKLLSEDEGREYIVA